MVSFNFWSPRFWAYLPSVPTKLFITLRTYHSTRWLSPRDQQPVSKLNCLTSKPANFCLCISANSSKRRKAQFQQIITPQFTTWWWSAQEKLASSTCKPHIFHPQGTMTAFLSSLLLRQYRLTADFHTGSPQVRTSCTAKKVSWKMSSCLTEFSSYSKKLPTGNRTFSNSRAVKGL